MRVSAAAAIASLFLITAIAVGDDAGQRIAWYGTLESGLAEAARSDRPILLVSGAPQCLGVSGIW